MKITKRQLKRIIKEEKLKLNEEEKSAAYTNIVKESRSPGDAIADLEKGLAAIVLNQMLNDGEAGLPNKYTKEIYQYMSDIGYEDFDTQAALDQLADRYNL
jgi:hypothetical protein